MPIHRCPRCAHRPLQGDEPRCPECSLDLEQVRADMVLLMRPPSGSERMKLVRQAVTVERRARAASETRRTTPQLEFSIDISLRDLTDAMHSLAPTDGDRMACPRCHAVATLLFVTGRKLEGGRRADGWFCVTASCGYRSIEQFLATD
ncbi:MAG TPA: hypothetical protein VNJ04_20095 [Gemmatimonadaceae bacterium]|nr:hypothetical protein [Gemmatimonadaceae bacterium]